MHQRHGRIGSYDVSDEFRTSGLSLLRVNEGGQQLVTADRPNTAASGPPGPIHLWIGRAISMLDVEVLCERVSAEVGAGASRTVLCEAGELTDADLGTVDALARLRLRARRLGCDVRLEHAPAELRDLLCLLGLDDVVPCCAESGLETWREAEGREEAGGVEEERDPGDPIA